MIKKLLLLLIILALAFASLTFLLGRLVNLEQLKEKVVDFAQSALEQDVSLQKLSISLYPALQLRLKGLEVSGRGEFADDTLVSVKEASAKIHLASLLRGEFEINEVFFEAPEITVVRSEKGNWNTDALAASGTSQEVAEGPRPQDLRDRGRGFMATSIVVKDGSFTYLDRARKVPSEVQITRIDTRMKDLSLTHPIAFNLRAATPASSLQNLELSGRVGPLGENRDLSALHGQLRCDLDPIDFNKIKSEIPRLKDIPLSSAAIRDGYVEGAIERLVFSESGGLEGFYGNLGTRISSLETNLFRQPLSDLAVRLKAEGTTVRLEEGSAALGKGALKFQGVCQSVFTQPRSQFRTELRNVELHDATRLGRRAEDLDLYGTLNADVEIAFNGLTKEQIFHTLAGQGQIEVTQGLVRNLNVLARVIDKVASIPFFGADIRRHLSRPHLNLLAQRDMRVQLAQTRFSIESGNAKVWSIDIFSDAFQVQGGGHVSLSGHLKLDCYLVVSPELSFEITRAIEELTTLMDPYGRLVLPFTVAGSVSNPQVTVSKEHILGRVLPAAGERVIRGFLGEGSEATEGAGSKARELLEKIF